MAEILGYTNPSKALADHVDKEDKLNNDSLLSLGQRGGFNNPDGSIKISKTPKVTGKGQQHFINKFLGGRKDERIVY